MSRKVKVVLSHFDEVDEEARKIRLSQAQIATHVVAPNSSEQCNRSASLNQRREHACADPATFVGRKEDQEKLLQFLCPSNNHGHPLSIGAIIGMGGIGKTTLARWLFDHENIGVQFARNKMWVSVSPSFDINRILNQMVESLTSSKGDLSNTDGIVSNLKQHLEGKKFFLVLDDVWAEDGILWDNLKGTLQKIGGLPGSVILITTRNNDVAMAAGAMYQHKLKGLSKDESWTLFEQKAFSSSTSPNVFGLEELGRSIVGKCQGVPLALKVMGALLQSKQHPHEWKAIEQSELWNLREAQNQILPSLLLSFTHLPSALKQCFSICAIIPKFDSLYKPELLGLWLAQGCLDKKNEPETLSFADPGEDYLKIMISRSLLEEVQLEGKEFVSYKMHDLVHDVAVFVCGSDLVTKTEQSSKGGRYLELSLIENGTTPKYLTEEVTSKLQTIWFTGVAGVVPWTLLVHARYLHTLSLSRCGIAKVPSTIRILKHLRYLCLCHNPIKTLPDSMSKLYQLQTLSLEGCLSIKKLPKVVNSLANLRHIWTNMPVFAWKGLSQLTNLQSLPCLILDDDDEGWGINELETLHDLKGDIGIRGLEWVNDKETAWKAGLYSKAKVLNLTLAWGDNRKDVDGDTFDEDVLNGLQPHPNITSLNIHNFNGEKFPTWVMRMSVSTAQHKDEGELLRSLTIVKLLNCRRCRKLPTMGQLPLLMCLIVDGLDVECIDDDFYGNGVVSFQSLKQLEISRLKRLTTWTMPSYSTNVSTFPSMSILKRLTPWKMPSYSTNVSTFPSLEILRVRECPELKSIPALDSTTLKTLELCDLKRVKSLGLLKYSTSLTSLVMKEMPEIKSLPGELRDYKLLQRLKICELNKLVCLPTGLGTLKSLRSMTVKRCGALTYVSHGVSLRELCIVGCSGLRKLPASLTGCKLLERLEILFCPLVVSPADMRVLINISKLDVYCNSEEHLRCMLESVQHLPHLRTLGIELFGKEDGLKECVSDTTHFLSFQSLKYLILYGVRTHCMNVLPQQLGLLNQIIHLYIWGFPDLEEIPEWIHIFSSLELLEIEECEKVRRLPPKEVLQRLPKLYYLIIKNCPELVEKYGKEKGSEWHQIQHLKCIKMDGKLIR